MECDADSKGEREYLNSLTRDLFVILKEHFMAALKGEELRNRLFSTEEALAAIMMRASVISQV
jgi:hypothetical protein